MSNTEYFQLISILEIVREMIQELGYEKQDKIDELHFKELYQKIRLFIYNIRMFYSDNFMKSDFLKNFKNKVYEFFQQRIGETTIIQLLYDLQHIHFRDIIEKCFNKAIDFLDWELKIIYYYQTKRGSNISKRLQKHQDKLNLLIGTVHNCCLSNLVLFFPVFKNILSQFRPSLNEKDLNITFTSEDGQLVKPLDELSTFDEIQAFSQKYLSYYIYEQRMNDLIFYIQQTDELKTLLNVPEINDRHKSETEIQGQKFQSGNGVSRISSQYINQQQQLDQQQLNQQQFLQQNQQQQRNYQKNPQGKKKFYNPTIIMTQGSIMKVKKELPLNINPTPEPVISFFFLIDELKIFLGQNKNIDIGTFKNLLLSKVGTDLSKEKTYQNIFETLLEKIDPNTETNEDYKQSS